ncbi:helix-turn-helix domain-containing protein [Leptospira licerasiae]|uniref:helix-turn-helix domain-containing protein n=1 Tax=Leptospira licerasiae TaxID=447106 RepID=UPI001083CDC3|nr:helix-turn-helix domain-containing protein [Leptospira licerasiae]TGM87929.1 hypothetical protein EHR05_14860 [Leptospira licerasiae]
MDLEKQEVRGDYIPPEINALDYWPQMRMLLAKIAYLDQKAQRKTNNPDAGCFARNKYFANQFKIKKQTVSKYIMMLKENGDINITFTLNKKGKKQRIIKSKYAKFFFKDQKNQSNTCLTGINQSDGQRSNDSSQTGDSNQTPKVHSSQNDLDPTIVQKTKSGPLTFDSLVSTYGIEIFSESLKRAILQGMGTNINYINGICKNVKAEKSKPFVEAPKKPNSVQHGNANQIDSRNSIVYDSNWESLILWSKENLSRSTVEVLEKVNYRFSGNTISINDEVPETLRKIITKFFTDKVQYPIEVVFHSPSNSVHVMDNLDTEEIPNRIQVSSKKENEEDLYPNQEEINKFIEALQPTSNKNAKKEIPAPLKFPEVAIVQYINIANGKREQIVENGNGYLLNLKKGSERNLETISQEIRRSTIPGYWGRAGVS